MAIQSIFQILRKLREGRGIPFVGDASNTRPPQKKGALSAKPEYNSGDCAFVFAITTPTISGKATITDQLRFVKAALYSVKARSVVGCVNFQKTG